MEDRETDRQRQHRADSMLAISSHVRPLEPNDPSIIVEGTRDPAKVMCLSIYPHSDFLIFYLFITFFFN